MDIAAELLGLEEVFWRAAGSREKYADNLAPDAVHVFPGWGVVTDRERVLRSVEDAEPWESFTIDDPQVVALGDDAAALLYTTRANRAGQAPYLAAITTVYRRDEGDWRLVVHQQTPL
jgi:hypothetical protein